MPYNSQVTRADLTEVLARPEYVNQIFQSAVEQSAVMQLARRLPNMGSQTTNMAVLSAMPIAYFVNGDTGLKQTTEQAWSKKTITAEEIAAIVPIPEAVLADSNIDIWGEIKPRIGEAIGRVVDNAILFDVSSPTSWPDAIMTSITANSKTISLAANPDLYDAVLSENGTFALVEACGYANTGSIASVGMQGRLRGNRTSEGMPIFQRALDGTYTFSGERIIFQRNGAWNEITALQINGQWDQIVFSIRQDMTFKLLTEGVIQDEGGTIIYNLAQQDMVALRCVFRMGWQIANPINSVDETGTRYPFAALVP